MKRLAIALSTIGLSTTIFAAFPATTDPTLIAVPQLPGGIVIGGTAYYLESSVTHGDLDYASIATSPNPILKSIEPNYDWGWGVNLGYIFPNTGNDISLNYFQLKTDDADSVIGTTLSGLINSLAIAEFGDPLFTSKASIDIQQLDLTVGQFIDVGCRLILHPNVGVRWADVNRKIDSAEARSIVSGVSTISSLFTVHEQSDFTGVGPLIGLDASYYIGAGFGIVGHFDSALLWGDIDSKARYFVFQSIGPGFIFDNKASFNRMVPVVDGKLGADYTFVFNNAANSALTFEVGYQASHYFNVLDRIFGGESGIRNHLTGDLGLNGPYASLTLHI